MDYISKQQYLKKHNKKKLTDNQKNYLLKVCDTDKDEKLLIPYFLEWVDLRRKPKKDAKKTAYYYTILKAINDNRHVSARLFEISDEFFLGYLEELIKLGLLRLIRNELPNYSESYQPTSLASSFISKSKFKAMNKLQEIVENILSKALAEYVIKSSK